LRACFGCGEGRVAARSKQFRLHLRELVPLHVAGRGIIASLSAVALPAGRVGHDGRASGSDVAEAELSQLPGAEICNSGSYAGGNCNFSTPWTDGGLRPGLAAWAQDRQRRLRRDDALRDGLLIDVSAAAGEEGIRWPVALTSAASSLARPVIRPARPSSPSPVNRCLPGLGPVNPGGKTQVAPLTLGCRTPPPPEPDLTSTSTAGCGSGCWRGALHRRNGTKFAITLPINFPLKTEKSLPFPAGGGSCHAAQRRTYLAGE
jgi:hypothetical protein